MKCPVCVSPDLVMTERQGIEIDYCPSCRGVWLDRGELDKIIERSEQRPSSAPAAPANPQMHASSYHRSSDSSGMLPPVRGNHPHPQSHPGQRPMQQPFDQGYYQKPKKKKSFWSELFD